MGSVNKIILVGHLGADPELRFTEKGTAVCTMRLATNTSWRDAQGQRQDKVSWHRVVAWGKQGQLCKEYLSKGRQVYIEGRLDTSTYTDAQGNKRYSTEVVSNAIVFLAGPGAGQRARAVLEESPEAEEAYDEAPNEAEEGRLPF